MTSQKPWVRLLPTRGARSRPPHLPSPWCCPGPALQMHDGPVRMLAKGMLRAIVPWQQARRYFVARLRRRLTEEALLKHIAGACRLLPGT